MIPIPLVDLTVQHRLVADEVMRGFASVLDATDFVLGRAVSDFEAAFARFCGVSHCVGVGNGTDGIELALRSQGIGPGDEVIVPANTFIATPLAVARCGATPVFADVDPSYLLMDPADVATRFTPRTRAIVAVHLFGQIAPMCRLRELIGDRSIALIEDAAQSQGARQDGRVAGSLGCVAATSFYPGKNLGAYGDAGGVLTDDESIARRVFALRNYGTEVKYHHPEMGFNSRLDTLQAVVLLAKLAHLESWNEARRAAAARYDGLLSDVACVTRPEVVVGNEHVWHLYVVRVPERDRVLARLKDSGIGAAVHYPVPCHLQGAFRYLGHRRGDFPVTEQAADEILSLPMFPGITEEQQARVVDALRAGVGC